VDVNSILEPAPPEPTILTLLNVETPATVRLLSCVVREVLIPGIDPADAVTVTTPAEIGETETLDPKSIVPAVPTRDPPSLTITPEPDAVIPVNPEPSPMNEPAVSPPLEELYFKELEDFGALFPVSLTPNITKHSVSDASLATVTLVAVVAVAAFPVTSEVIVDGSLSSLIVPVNCPAGILVNEAADPLKVVAVTTPVRLTLPVPVISFPLTSKLPPSCGVVSEMTSERPPPPPPPLVAISILATPPEIVAVTPVPIKFIVCAVPTFDPSSRTTTPDPTAVIPVSPEPSPLNDAAVTIPVVLILVSVPKPEFPILVRLLSAIIA
jgi:hypothetical protein